MKICKLCGESIIEGQRWEYYKAYAFRTPEDQKERVHSGCVGKLCRDVITRLAAVPENERDQFSIEIEGIVNI